MAKQTEPSITTEETIERGLAAASLLSSTTFQDVIKSLGVECFATFTESEPEDTQGRDAAYNLYRGLQAIEAELLTRVQAQEEAVRKLDADLEDQDDLDGPIHIQGNTDR